MGSGTLTRRPRALIAVAVAAVLLILFGVDQARSQSESEGPPPKYMVEVPSSMPIGVPIQIPVSQLFDANRQSTPKLEVGGSSYDLSFERGEATAEDVTVQAGGDTTIRMLEDGSAVPFTSTAVPVAGPADPDVVTEASVDVLVPGFMTIVPAVLAIALALAFKKVLPALFGGVWLAAWISTGYSLTGLWTSLLRVFDTYILQAVTPPDGDSGHIGVILFTFFIGGTVGIITRNGGTRGLVNRFTGIATSPQQAQAATGALGVGIFFGGYTSSLIVGNAMRPVTDHFKLSREKLAYSVDSTASPIATLMIVSTWVGYQVGLIEDAIGKVQGIDANAYAVFLQSIPYSFYAFMAIFMVFLIAFTSRDYGPMLKAEVRARRGQVQSRAARADDDEDATQEAGSEAQDLKPKESAPPRLINSAGPIGVLIIGVVVALLVTGEGATLWERIGSADSTKALVWSSAIAMLTAFLMTLAQRILTLSETIDAWFAGVKSVLFVLFILTLAWALSAATNDLHTGPYLANLLGDTLPPFIMPAVIFALAAGIAFAVGTSWGTMGILTPLVVPLAYTVLSNNNMVGDGGLHPIFLASIAAVLGGAVWGDHCSPISDTTIISALSSGCEVIEHTRTQLPYAFLSAGAGVLLGHIPVGFGAPWWVAIPLCAIGVTAFVFLFGKKADEIADEADDDLEPEEAIEQREGDTGPVEDIRESVMSLFGRSDESSSTRFGL